MERLVHELSLCRSIGGIVQRAAQGRPVQVVEVDVGALRQVVPTTLERCWSLVADANLKGSRLEVHHIPAVLRCRVCGAQTTLTDLPLFECEACGSVDVEVVSGEEFMVRSIVLDTG